MGDAGETMATSQGSGPSASTGGAAGVFRDRDPPPGYDGEQPELTFRQFQRQVRLWEHETDLPRAKRGAKLLRQLTGVAALAVEDLEIDLIIAETGVKNIMTQLEAYFLPHLEVSMPRAFETAVYGESRAAKESFASYVKRMERAFNHLSKEGVDLPEGAKGYIMYRQAALTEAQDQRLLTWAEGKYGLKEIISALRRLDKVVREKGKTAYFEDRSYEGELEAYETEELYGDLPDSGSLQGSAPEPQRPKAGSWLLPRRRQGQECSLERQGQGQNQDPHRAAEAANQVPTLSTSRSLGERVHYAQARRECQSQLLHPEP